MQSFGGLPDTSVLTEGLYTMSRVINTALSKARRACTMQRDRYKAPSSLQLIPFMARAGINVYAIYALLLIWWISVLDVGM